MQKVTLMKDDEWEWKYRCPFCFSCDFKWGEDSMPMPPMMECGKCGALVRKESAKRTLPKSGGYLEVTKQTEIPA